LDKTLYPVCVFFTYGYESSVIIKHRKRRLPQARNQLGTLEAAKSFLRGAQIF